MAKCEKCNKHFFSANSLKNGLCQECLADKINLLEKKLSKMEEELKETARQKEKMANDFKELKQKMPEEISEKEKLRLEIATLKEEKDRININISEASQTLKELKERILVASDTIELEEFSLYTPKFDFVNTDIYKLALDNVREKQKDAIKNGTAWYCNKKWMVEGSESKGRKFTEGVAKMALRAFNSECDNAVSAVRFSNFEKCKERVIKAFSVINNANKASEVLLAGMYLDLKIEELRIALEYQMKKEEEKEKAKEIRAQQREEARIAKEIEEARKETEKEKKHYQNALSKIDGQIMLAIDEEEKNALQEKKKELLACLSSTEEKLSDIDYRQKNQKAGYVYIISNIGSFGENVYKIGMTRRLDPQERVDELGDASVPFNFDIHAMIFSSDAPKLEAALHHAFEKKRVNKVNARREYFKVSLDEIKEEVKKNHDDTVEFFEVPQAAQYRESLLM